MRKVFLILLAVVFLFGGCGAKDEDVVLPDMAEVITESEDTSFSGSDISDEKEDVDMTVDNVEKPKTESKPVKETKVETVVGKDGKEVVSSGSKSEAVVEDKVSTEKESTDEIKDTHAEAHETPVEAPEKEEVTKEEEKPKSAYDYSFDISGIKADCISVGKSMGLKVDSSLSPGNSTWWNPVTASESNQGTKLKNRLESYIRFHTIDNLAAYGIDEISYFNIYTEQVGEGKYKIYFLFA